MCWGCWISYYPCSHIHWSHSRCRHWVHCWCLQIFCQFWLWWIMWALWFVWSSWIFKRCWMLKSMCWWKRKMYHVLQSWPRTMLDCHITVYWCCNLYYPNEHRFLWISCLVWAHFRILWLFFIIQLQRILWTLQIVWSCPRRFKTSRMFHTMCFWNWHLYQRLRGRSSKMCQCCSTCHYSCSQTCCSYSRCC